MPPAGKPRHTIYYPLLPLLHSFCRLQCYISRTDSPTFLRGLWADWLTRAFIFLVISCPCALVISIPLTFFSGIGAASRKGILVKGSNYLEALTQLGTVVFDKTGTLTKGVFRVTAIDSTDNFSKDTVLHLRHWRNLNPAIPLPSLSARPGKIRLIRRLYQIIRNYPVWNLRRLQRKRNSGRQ